MGKIIIYTDRRSGLSGYNLSAIDCSDDVIKNLNVMNAVMQLCRLREIYGHNDNNNLAYTFGFNLGG